MPPQPLSKVRPDASIVNLGPDSLAMRPQLAVLVAQIIGFCSEVDLQRGRLLSTLLGAGDGPALAMYLALTSATSRRAALRAAAHSVLNQKEEELWLAISKFATPIDDERNDFAHGLWGHTDDVPDGLLLVDQIYRIKQMLQIGDTIQEIRTGPFIIKGRSVPLDYTKINVYRASDFKRTLRSVKKAYSLFQEFINLVSMSLIPEREQLRDRLASELPSHKKPPRPS